MSFSNTGRRVVLGLASAYLLYVVAAFFVLNVGGLPAKINKSWNDGDIRFVWAWSPFPAALELHGFELRHEDHNVHWNLKLDRVWAAVDLMDLFYSRFTVTELVGSGVGFQFYEKRLAKEQKWKKFLPPVPDVPGRIDTPLEKNKKYPLPEEPFKVRIRGVRLRHFHTLWFDQYRYTGRAEIGGGFAIAPQVQVEVRPARLRTWGGELRIGAQSIADGVDLNLSGEIAPFPAQAVPGMEIFHYITAKLDLVAKGKLAPALNLYLQGAWPMRTETGEGALTANLFLQEGVFQNQSRVGFHSDDLAFSLGAAAISGKADFDWSVQEGKAAFGVLFSDFEMASWIHPAEAPLMEGEYLSIQGGDLGVSMIKGFAGGGTRFLELKDARLNIGAVQNFLPKRTPVQFLGGEATLSARFEGEADGLDKGQVSLDSDGTRIKYQKTELMADLDLQSEVLSKSLPSGDLSLANLELKLDQVRVSQDPPGTDPWWARVTVPAGSVKLGEKSTVVLPASFSFKNAAPLLAVFKLDEKVPGFVKGALNEQRLNGQATLKVDKDMFSVKQAWIKNKRLKIQGRYQSATWDTRGVIFAQWDPFAIGLELIGEKINLVLHDAAKWYRNYPPLSEPIPLRQ